MEKFSLIFVFVTTTFILNVVGYYEHHRHGEHEGESTGEWLVRLKNENPKDAKAVAKEFGFKKHHQVPGFKKTFIMKELPKLQKKDELQLTKDISDHKHVDWAEQQFLNQVRRPVLTPIVWYESQHLSNDILNDYDFPVEEEMKFKDELWDEQWYMHSDKPNLNVLPCYKDGITGKGVRVAIVDNGVEWTHQDLKENYDPEISYDVLNQDFDPSPEVNETGFLPGHGTACAGIVAMKANNGKCGVGIAFNAKIGGIRLIDKNDKYPAWHEGIALGFAYDKVDIYSNSWGPPNDGTVLKGPDRLANEAIQRGIKEGRNGKGSIFVFAAGNGDYTDDCNCDGYVNSIYTIAVAGVSKRMLPSYNESCSSILTTTFSNGNDLDPMIATTSALNRCMTGFGGTSAAVPQASGIIALALEANPELTWRDVQHLIVWTSEYEPLKDDLGWYRNRAGYWINKRFGYGLMNAYAMVTAAMNWTTVPESSTCIVEAKSKNKEFNTRYYTFNIDAKSCNKINYLEHVQLQINIDYPYRGMLKISLTSPKGTEVQLLRPRYSDKSPYGFKGWKLMSVLTWNENPQGIWKVLVKDSSKKPSNRKGVVRSLTLHLQGTEQRPKYLENGPRNYGSKTLSNDIMENFKVRQ